MVKNSNKISTSLDHQFGRRPQWRRCLFLFLILTLAFSANASEVFKNAEVNTSYSKMLLDKQARDTLLPDLDGDAELEALLRRFPGVWAFERVDKGGELMTRLKVDLVYIDGTREEQTCEIIEGPETDDGVARLWNLKINVDFTGGGSVVVKDHIGLCLRQVRDEVGYAVKQGEKVVFVPPDTIRKEIENVEINDSLDFSFKTEILDVQKEVEVSGECPTDIRTYVRLLEIFDQVKNTRTDLLRIAQELNPEENGNQTVYSCAFSRRWNQRYSEVAVLDCDVNAETCMYDQSEDGITNWKFHPPSDQFRFIPRKFLFIPFGGKSIHYGGRMLDLKLVPLSKNLYLEAYLDLNGAPVALGFLTIGKEGKE